MSSNVVVLDNGGGFIKAGIGGDCDPAVIVPNCVGRSSLLPKRLLVADQLQSCEDHTSIALRRPFDRGYLVNPTLQKEIWDRLFTYVLRIDPSTSSLLLVEPLFNLPSIQNSIDELVFEDFGFKSLYVADSPSLVHIYEASRRPNGLISKTQCSLVIDCGFSFTHVAPVLQNFTINYGVRRLDLGGKALTNYLKELISYRSINVMDETLIIDEVKEKLCFVSLDIGRDLKIARIRGSDNPFKCTFVLPDGITHTRGYIKNPSEAQRYLSVGCGTSQEEPSTGHGICGLAAGKAEQKTSNGFTKNEFSLTNERFLVPEVLFHPADIGMNEAGLAECVVRSVNACHPDLHPVLFGSIILTGGSTLFPQFAKRLEKELRPLVCDQYDVKIISQEDPVRGVWRGGSLLASSPDFESVCVSKAEYEELGSGRCRNRFMH